MTEITTISRNENALLAATPLVFEGLSNPKINIAIWERSVAHLEASIHALLEQRVRLRCAGSTRQLMATLLARFPEQKYTPLLQDMETLIEIMKRQAQTQTLRLLLAVLEDDMCRKFHTDINDLRLLCTYHGPGTCWLTESNSCREALANNEEEIARDPKDIRQAGAGDVLLLKGALYDQPEGQAAIHRSPAVRERGSKRLLLRLDTQSGFSG